jgi:HlyD family secretion protein
MGCDLAGWLDPGARVAVAGSCGAAGLPCGELSPGAAPRAAWCGSASRIAIAAGLVALGMLPGPVTGSLAAQEPVAPAETKAAEPKAEAKPAETVSAERGRFEVALDMKGEFVPLDMAVVEFNPQGWRQPLEIVTVVPHGTRVNAGDVIIQFDPRKLDEAITDAEMALAVSDKAIEIARRELPVAEALQPLEMAAAERAGRIAAEDLKRWQAVERRQFEESARFGLKAAEEFLKYSSEELRQLQQMYKDKDLTEETEEMILQRTRFEVEQAEFRLKNSRLQTEESLTIEAPRRDEAATAAAARSALDLEKARGTLGLRLDQKRLELAKDEYARAQALRKLGELKDDRQKVALKAPRAGIVYYGRLHDGSWSTAAVAAKAAPGQDVPPGDLVFTVVDPARVGFDAVVEEKDLHLVAPGLKGRVEPAGYPDLEVPAALEAFGGVPKNGRYNARFAVTAVPGGPALLPGMNGTARCQVYARPDAVTLPASAVLRDDDGSRVVYLPGQPAAVKRPVKVGRTASGRVEILEGVSAGEAVLAKRP